MKTFAAVLALGLLSSVAQAETTKIHSSAFQDRAEMPAKYTCEGKNISPPLSWSDVPANTKSFALIIDDPDAPDPAAPKRTWGHWVLYNLPADSNTLPEAVTTLPKGAKPGLNDWNNASYGGPCPPTGRHRYFHKLYALDIVLPKSLGSPSKAQLEKAMNGHILAKAELIGTYLKTKWLCTGTMFDKLFCRH